MTNPDKLTTYVARKAHLAYIASSLAVSDAIKSNMFFGGPDEWCRNANITIRRLPHLDSPQQQMIIEPTTELRQGEQ